MAKLLAFGFVLLLIAACGVKADPQAPLAPADIGHGKALYKNDDEAPAIPRKAIIDDEQKSDDSEDKD